MNPNPRRQMTRRDCISRAVSLSAVGIPAYALSHPSLNANDARTAATAKSAVFVFLFGGPSQVDLTDLKPQAPVEIRGEFQPISTTVSGLELCEHLPLLAKQAERFCLVRSMTHRMPVHGPACSEIYSGREYFGAPITDQARIDDWPSIASMVQRFSERDRKSTRLNSSH